MFSSPPLFISTRNNVVTPKFRRRDGTAVDKATIEAFRHGFQGQVLLPGDAGYSSARRIWNASIDKHPGLISRCSTLFGGSGRCSRGEVCAREQSSRRRQKRRSQRRRPGPVRRWYRHRSLGDEWRFRLSRAAGGARAGGEGGGRRWVPKTTSLAWRPPPPLCVKKECPAPPLGGA